MAETYELSLNLHKFFTYALTILSFAYLIFIFLPVGATKKQKIKFTNRIRLLLPIYYAFFAAICVTGAFNWAALHFLPKADISVMLFSAVIFIILNIKAYKALKIAYIKDDFQKYRIKAAKILAVILMCILISSVV